MTNYNSILALDPSGNFHEGKGTTGWCIFDCAAMRVVKWGYIEASKFKSMEAYWDAHIALITKYITKHQNKPGSAGIVIEDYLLYGTKAQDQVNSRMETPKVIGLMQYWCYKNKQEYHMQPASMVKTRWSNDILSHKDYIRKVEKGFRIPGLPGILNRHCIDSIRHAVHYATFSNKVVLKNKNKDR